MTYDRRTIGLGMRWSGLTVRIVPAGELIHVYHGKTLVRSLAFDPNPPAPATGQDTEGDGRHELACVREVPGTRCQGSLRNAQLEISRLVAPFRIFAGVDLNERTSTPVRPSA